MERGSQPTGEAPSSLGQLHGRFSAENTALLQVKDTTWDSQERMYLLSSQPTLDAESKGLMVGPPGDCSGLVSVSGPASVLSQIEAAPVSPSDTTSDGKPAPLNQENRAQVASVRGC